jgi:hypothetical protein
MTKLGAQFRDRIDGLFLSWRSALRNIIDAEISPVEIRVGHSTIP